MDHDDEGADEAQFERRAAAIRAQRIARDRAEQEAAIAQRCGPRPSEQWLAAKRSEIMSVMDPAVGTPVDWIDAYLRGEFVTDAAAFTRHLALRSRSQLSEAVRLAKRIQGMTAVAAEMFSNEWIAWDAPRDVQAALARIDQRLRDAVCAIHRQADRLAECADLSVFDFGEAEGVARAAGETVATVLQDDDEFVPIAEAARRLGETTETVRGWVNRRREPLRTRTIAGISHLSMRSARAEQEAKRVSNPLRRGVRSTSAPIGPQVPNGSRTRPRHP